jgi:hypothetical protein
VERLAGCHLDPGWVQEVSYLGDRLEAISRTLAETSEFYCCGPPSNCLGDIPEAIGVRALEILFSSEEEAQAAAKKAKRGLLSFLRFLSWMLSLVQLRDTKLSSGDQQYLQQLRLDDHPKTGAIFNLTRDQHEINFPHWANNGVAFHYIWTEEEAKKKRFLRFSPEYHEEVAPLREAAKNDDISVENLPSYALWKDDLESSDWIGQNLRAGKMGVVEQRFSLSMRYSIVDRHLYGARPLVNWITIRVYAEHFKALIREGERETVCTFFRNNPIYKDKPAYGSQPLNHRFKLSNFAYEEVGESASEQARHYESNTVVREQVKNLYAPRPDRPFNSFNGGPALSLPGGLSANHRGRRGDHPGRGETSRASGPLRAGNIPAPRRSSCAASISSLGSRADLEIQSSWARAVAGQRRRSSHSLSPVRHEEKGKRRQARSLSSVRAQEPNRESIGFEEEFFSASDSSNSDTSDMDDGAGAEEYKIKEGTPFDASLDPVGSWSPKY